MAFDAAPVKLPIGRARPGRLAGRKAVLPKQFGRVPSETAGKAA